MRQFQKIMTAVFLALFAILLQSTFLKFVLPAHAVPNFCMLFVVFLAFNDASVGGAVLAFLVGILLDLSSGVLLGPWSASFSAGYGTLSLLSRRVFLDSFPAAFFVVFLSAIFCNLIYIGLLYEFQPSSFDVIAMLLESFMTALVAPFVIKILSWLLVHKTALFSSGRGKGA